MPNFIHYVDLYRLQYTTECSTAQYVQKIIEIFLQHTKKGLWWMKPDHSEWKNELVEISTSTELPENDELENYIAL